MYASDTNEAQMNTGTHPFKPTEDSHDRNAVDQQRRNDFLHHPKGAQSRTSILNRACNSQGDKQCYPD